MNEALVADGIRTCHIIYKDTSSFRLGIDVDDGFAALAVDSHFSGGIYRAIEGVVAKLVGVVTQEVVRLQVDVVAQSGEVLVVDTSIHYCNIVVAVVDGVSQQLDVIRNGMCPQVLKAVVCAQLLHVHLAVCYDITHQVDVFKIAHYVQLALAPCLNVVHETSTEAFQEFQAGTLRLNTQVYVVALRRYIAVDECLVFWSVISHSLDVYLALFLIEVHVGMQYSQRSVFKLEVFHVELGVGIRIIEDALHDGLS